ncbi:calmodulin-like [Kogia breviceps]|uniref:calmodulin-like n=1 Tax=Kogia breviceps TaxID=27615 RepID=UPI0034D2BD18
MAEQLSTEQVAEFMEAFDKFDKDKDGAINIQELGAVMQELGLDPSEAALKVSVARVDEDGDGVISSQEFLAVIAKEVQTWARADDLRTAFHAFDLDGNGYISVAELKRAMAQLEEVSQEELAILIREADVDGDGQVNYKEFVRVLTQK